VRSECGNDVRAPVNLPVRLFLSPVLFLFATHKILELTIMFCRSSKSCTTSSRARSVLPAANSCVSPSPFSSSFLLSLA